MATSNLYISTKRTTFPGTQPPWWSTTSNYTIMNEISRYNPVLQQILTLVLPYCTTIDADMETFSYSNGTAGTFQVLDSSNRVIGSYNYPADGGIQNVIPSFHVSGAECKNFASWKFKHTTSLGTWNQTWGNSSIHFQLSSIPIIVPGDKIDSTHWLSKVLNILKRTTVVNVGIRIEPISFDTWYRLDSRVCKNDVRSIGTKNEIIDDGEIMNLWSNVCNAFEFY